MSVSEDKIEQERIARQAAIKEALAESEPAVAEAPAAAEASRGSADGPKEEPLVAYDQELNGTIHYRKLKDWEAIDSKGRVFQYRRLTSAELEAEEERAFLKKRWQADQAHAEKVAAAIKEAEREQKDMDKRRKHEETTGRRPYNERRFISLAEAERRGLIGNGSSDNSGGEEYGLFASGGRMLGSRQGDNNGRGGR